MKAAPNNFLGPGTTGWPDLPEVDLPSSQRESIAHAAGPDGNGWWIWAPGPTPPAIDLKAATGQA